jgi:hypothetical protein
MTHKYSMHLDKNVVEGLKPYLKSINLPLSTFVRVLLAQVYSSISGAVTVVDFTKPVEELTLGDLSAITEHFLSGKPKAKRKKRVSKQKMIDLRPAMTEEEIRGISP